MAKYSSIDLFAGIGGIRLGFENAFGKDIKTVFVSEWDEFAQLDFPVKLLAWPENIWVLMMTIKESVAALYFWMLQGFVSIINQRLFFVKM